MDSTLEANMIMRVRDALGRSVKGLVQLEEADVEALDKLLEERFEDVCEDFG